MRRIALLAALLALAGCGGSRAPTPLVVDTDLSSDDLIALAYVLQQPDAQVEAVTISGTGLVDCPGGAEEAAGLLAALGHPEIPVACGRTLPLEGLRTLPPDWRRAADTMFGLTLPHSPTTPQKDAMSLLADTVEHASKPPTVLELAPMTNLAGALRRHPDLAGKLGRVVAMGGAVGVPGNAPESDAAETNVWLDPAAARTVLRSGAPITLVPLDATNDVPVTTFVAQALRRYHVESPAATIAWDVVLATAMDHRGQYWWDPLAAAAALRPGLVTLVQKRLDIDDDGRALESEAGAPVAVAVGAERRAFERELLSTLLGGKDFAIPRDRPDATVTFTGSGCTYGGAKDAVAGELVLDAVNRSPGTFTLVTGRLEAGHTLADLRRLIASDAKQAPGWITVDFAGTTPPHSRMTWLPSLQTGASGATIVACQGSDPPRVWVAAELPVYAHR